MNKTQKKNANLQKNNPPRNNHYNSTMKKTHFTRMNCSPAVKGKAPVRGSCFTNEVLIQLKESYNKHNLTNKIEANDPTHIWNELKNRLSTCQKEDCWLNEIRDPLIRAKIDTYIFAPDQPAEWKNQPDTWLSNFDICDVLKQYEDPYPNFKVFGPTPIDFDARPKSMNGQCVWQELCTFSLENMLKQNKTKLGIVFNLDKHKDKGSHWISMYVDLDDQYIFYLDSAGKKIPRRIKALATKIIQQGRKKGMHIHFHENCPTAHQKGANECGMYALYFIITMLTGETENTKFVNYSDKIDFFKNKRIPDKYVHKYRKIYFNY